MRRGLARDIALLAGLLLTLGLFLAFGPRRAEVQSNDIPSSHSVEPLGAQALYQWVGALGYDPQRLEYRAFELTERDAALLVIGPSQPISRREAESMLNWVDAGGTLIFAEDDRSGFPQSQALIDALDIEFRVFTETSTIDRVTARQPAFDSPAAVQARVDTGVMLVPRSDDMVVLLGTDQSPVLVGRVRGKGYIFISSSVNPFVNGTIGQSQHPELVVNLLRRVPRGGRVVFDEYHHGLVPPPTPAFGGSLALAFTSTWGWALMYLAAISALYLIFSSRRFGRAIPLAEESRRRSSAEYVEGMADLLQRGGKRAYIAQHYHTAFKRRVARRYGVSPSLDDAAFVQELGRFASFDAAALLTLLRQLRADTDEAALLDAVRRADAYRVEA